MHFDPRPFLVPALVAAGLAAQQQPYPDMVETGSRPDYTFQEGLLNGRGLRSLAEFQGKPTLIEFWGTR